MQSTFASGPLQAIFAPPSSGGRDRGGGERWRWRGQDRRALDAGEESWAPRLRGYDQCWPRSVGSPRRWTLDQNLERHDSAGASKARGDARRCDRGRGAGRASVGWSIVVPYRAGFACFVGRPNAGKSTLTNAIIGQKIAITSNRPQTTRHVIRGVLHRPDAQLVLVDTPGLHRPRTLLGERLNDLVREVWSEVDVVGLCLPADEEIGRGDRYISAEIASLRASVVAVVTKTDLVDRGSLVRRLAEVGELADFADVVPVSAVSGDQLGELV